MQACMHVACNMCLHMHVRSCIHVHVHVRGVLNFVHNVCVLYHKHGISLQTTHVIYLRTHAHTCCMYTYVHVHHCTQAIHWIDHGLIMHTCACYNSCLCNYRASYMTIIPSGPEYTTLSASEDPQRSQHNILGKSNSLVISHRLSLSSSL